MARYQQAQAAWSRDAFLQHGGAGSNPAGEVRVFVVCMSENREGVTVAKCRNVTLSALGIGKRRNMGFAEAFAEVHAANEHMRALYVQYAAVAGH